jgi:hypothetical protein
MLSDISVEATKVVLTSFIILGTIGNVLNLIIFTRPILLRSSCTLYLIAASVDNILVIYTSLLTRLMSGGFAYDVTIISNFTCKLRYYVGYIFFAVSPYFMILACFDRYCSSSASTARRSWSNKKVAKRLIIGAIILASIVYLHMGIFFEITTIGSSKSCYTRPGIYDLFYRIFYLIVYCILPSFCMGLFCALTFINIRQQSKRIQPALVAGNNNRRTRIERQMIKMLFSQVLTQLLGILPYAIISLLSILIDTQSIVFAFFSEIFILPLFVSYTTSFYVFTLSSPIYRQELMKLMWFLRRPEDRQERALATITTSTHPRQHPKMTVQNA